MKSVIQALKLSFEGWKVRRKARRLAIEMYGKGKNTREQKERYIRGYMDNYELISKLNQE